jgi:ribosomal protein L4
VEAEGHRARTRVGSIRSPLWRHGGTVHGPQPRSYDYAFPRKKLLGALRSALAAKLADGKLVVVESFELEGVKTKAVPPDAGQAERQGHDGCWWKARRSRTTTCS